MTQYPGRPEGATAAWLSRHYRVRRLKTQLGKQNAAILTVCLIASSAFWFTPRDGSALLPACIIGVAVFASALLRESQVLLRTRSQTFVEVFLRYAIRAIVLLLAGSLVFPLWLPLLALALLDTELAFPAQVDNGAVLCLCLMAFQAILARWWAPFIHEVAMHDAEVLRNRGEMPGGLAPVMRYASAVPTIYAKLCALVMPRGARIRQRGRPITRPPWWQMLAASMQLGLVLLGLVVALGLFAESTLMTAEGSPIAEYAANLHWLGLPTAAIATALALDALTVARQVTTRHKYRALMLFIASAVGVWLFSHPVVTSFLTSPALANSTGLPSTLLAVVSGILLALAAAVLFDFSQGLLAALYAHMVPYREASARTPVREMFRTLDEYAGALEVRFFAEEGLLNSQHVYLAPELTMHPQALLEQMGRDLANPPVGTLSGKWELILNEEPRIGLSAWPDIHWRGIITIDEASDLEQEQMCRAVEELLRRTVPAKWRFTEWPSAKRDLLEALIGAPWPIDAVAQCRKRRPVDLGYALRQEGEYGYAAFLCQGLPQVSANRVISMD